MAIMPLRELLGRPALLGAETLAGRDAIARRAIAGVSTIHWPAGRFARRGDLVLTTAVGGGRAELERLTCQVIWRGAAALGISPPPGEGREVVSTVMCEKADKAGLPLLLLPWELPFADVTRLVLAATLDADPSARPLTASAHAEAAADPLARLAADRGAMAGAVELLSPLVDYDERTGRNLVETLEVLLEEGLNVSAAARRLFLNRHSLLYRLEKIEALTGRRLDRSDDRFALELSVRLRRHAGHQPHVI